MALTLCQTACGRDVPELWPNACDKILPRFGGIPNLIFFNCAWQFDGVVTIAGVDTTIGPITDFEQWKIGVENQFIVRSPRGLGEKPETTPILTKMDSCNPEQVTGETHVLNFQSFSADTTNLLDCDYWNDIKTDYLDFRVSWLGCEDLVYVKPGNEPGFVFSYSTLGYIQPNDSNLPNFYQANLTFDFLGIPCPVEVPNLEEAFNAEILT